MEVPFETRGVGCAMRSMSAWVPDIFADSGLSICWRRGGTGESEAKGHAVSVNERSLQRTTGNKMFNLFSLCLLLSR